MDKPRRSAPPGKLHRRSLCLFGAGLALQCVILLWTAPGEARQGEPGAPSLCFTNCASISIESTANTFVSGVYTSTFTVGTSRSLTFFDAFTQTVRVGELLGAAEFLDVDVNQGRLTIQPMTYNWVVTDPFPPLVLTSTVQARDAGTHTQTLGRHITFTTVPEAETTTLVTALPSPFTLRYRFSPMAPVGVITETYLIAPGNDAISQTLVTGAIKSFDGSYRSVVGSGATLCNVSETRGFDCTVPTLGGTSVITATVELSEPGQLLHGLQVSGGGASLPLSLETRTHPIQVGISIKPAEHPNTIRIGRPHNIPVAILSSADFHVIDRVDVSTIRFGPTGYEASPRSCAPEYSNTDALIDLVCHFDGMQAAFKVGDQVGRLSGRTLPTPSFSSGLPFAGQDSVRIINPPR